MRGAQARTSAGESLPLLHQNLRVSLKIPWDYYMVHNDLWQVAGIGANMLCLGCFAQRALSIRLGFTDLDYCGVALWATPSIEPQQLAQLARTPADAVLLE